MTNIHYGGGGGSLRSTIVRSRKMIMVTAPRMITALNAGAFISNVSKTPKALRKNRAHMDICIRMMAGSLPLGSEPVAHSGEATTFVCRKPSQNEVPAVARSRRSMTIFECLMRRDTRKRLCVMDHGLYGSRMPSWEKRKQNACSLRKMKSARKHGMVLGRCDSFR